MKKTTKIAVRGIIAAVKAAVSSTKALMTLAMAGGGLVIFLIIIVGVIGGVLLFGNSQIVSVAMAQVGNVGGQKFWSWYGFPSREEWCACFVSWCADQCGLITSGAVPKFASCPAGVEWFRSNGKWKDGTHSPSAGTIIFFDWDGDGVSDHVGIVEKCENERVYTVEGNSGDAVRQEIYIHLIFTKIRTIF